jgi:hypothetical protein
MKIVTTLHPPGEGYYNAKREIMHWSAVDTDTYDYDQPMGWGISQIEAVRDLLDLLEEKNTHARKNMGL